jgi:hypothetical protein
VSRRLTDEDGEVDPAQAEAALAYTRKVRDAQGFWTMPSTCSGCCWMQHDDLHPPTFFGPFSDREIRDKDVCRGG